MNEREKLEALDKTLALLQEKDIKEISQTTRIATHKLEAILNKKFDELQRVHAMGFLQILQKEYPVDLSHWIVEYDKHFFAKSSLEPETPLTKTQEPHQTPSPFLDSTRVKDLSEVPSFEPEKTPRWYFILPLVALLVLGVGIYIYHKSPPSSESEPSAEPSTQTIPTLEEAPTPTHTPQLTPPPPASKTPPIQSPATATTTATNTPTGASKAPVEEPQSGTIVIAPKEEVWMERIDLHTHHKSQAILKEPYTLKTQGHKWLLAFGHGNLSIKANGQALDFNRDRPLRFLYTPKHGLTRISLSTYQKRSP